MKLMDFKFNKGWKILIYFDFLVPIVLFLFAFLFPISKIQSLFSILFHSYNLYIVKTIPAIPSLTGFIGLIYHIGIIGHTLKKRQYKDLLVCLAITLIITLIFLFELNYQFIKPLNFG